MKSHFDDIVIIRRTEFWYSIFFVLILLLPVLSTATIVTSGTASETDKARLMAIVNDQSASLDARTVALDSLSLMQDPSLLELFKDLAFRSSEKPFAAIALGMTWNFIYTDRWNEACDTLADVVRGYPDAEIRDSALQALKITEQAFRFGIPFDRHNVVDALIAAIDRDSYVKDARNFFSAVWLVAQIACKTDRHAVAALEYLRDHFTDEYTLDDQQNATYAYQSFKNSITKSYIDAVNGRTEPALITEIPVDSNVQLSISIAAYMLDSAVTDSLGFAALSWLATHAEGKSATEKQRLEYLYGQIARKRPDKASDIGAAFRLVLEKYGVGVIRHHNGRNFSSIRHYAIVVDRSGIVVNGLTQGDIVTMFDGAGRRYFQGVASMSTLRIHVPGHYYKATGLITVNGLCIRGTAKR